MILIVDDKPENIFALKSVLEVNNFETDAASSGEEALKKILKNHYALIILDVQMPGMDGFEVAETITNFNKTRDIPIIFLSAVNTHKRFVTKGFESGAVDYLTKPVDADILILKVRNFYRLYEKTHALKEAEKALTATVTELHSTLESLPQIAFTANANGELEFANENWLRFADSRKTFPQTHSAEPKLAEIWQSFLTGGVPFEKEVRLLELDTRQYRYHLLRVIPVRITGNITKWVGTLTDIHEQKLSNELLEKKVAERTRELLEINRELELSNTDLQQFASVASHDLREPLRKIQFFSNMIHDKGELSDTSARNLEKILRSAERMSNLITDLLSFTKLSAAEIFHPTDLKSIIEDILFDLELTIAEKNAVVQVEEMPTIEVIPGLLRQLFLNILGNALKFNREGVVPHISISAVLIDVPTDNAPPSESGRFCRISIADNGIGFDEKYTDKIFTLFQRLNPREQYEGTGIGLTIAKKIVDKHNGVLIARSRPGEGSTFHIILPTTRSGNPVIPEEGLVNTLT